MGLEKRQRTLHSGLKISLDFQFMGQMSDKLCCLSARPTSSNHPGYCLTPLHKNCSWYKIFLKHIHVFILSICFVYYYVWGYTIQTIYLSIFVPKNTILNRPKNPSIFFPFLMSTLYSVCQTIIWSAKVISWLLTGTKSILLNFKNVKNVCVCLNIHIIYK